MAKKRKSASRAKSAQSGELTLTAEQEKEFKKWSNTGFAARARRVKRLGAAKTYTIVAEGDSWFDYKPSYLEGGLLRPGRDLLGHLQAGGRFNVYRVSKAGDTMDNMVYGTDTKGKGSKERPHKPPQIEVTLQAIRDKKPEAFLFSGGGNDLAGTELSGYLNHRDSKLPALRKEVVDHVFNKTFPKALNDMIKRVRSVDKKLPIFLHGYGYAVPDGRPVVKLFKWAFMGPWLRPALVGKRSLDLTANKKLIRTLIDRFNNAIEKVATANANVHYIDVRPVLRSDAQYKLDWVNELHPKSTGFKKVADVFSKKILSELEP